MALIKQDKMPFMAEEFYDHTKAGLVRPGSRGTVSRKSQFAKQTDKFLATLSQGFGAAAANQEGRNGSAAGNDSTLSPRAAG